MQETCRANGFEQKKLKKTMEYQEKKWKTYHALYSKCFSDCFNMKIDAGLCGFIFPCCSMQDGNQQHQSPRRYTMHGLKYMQQRIDHYDRHPTKEILYERASSKPCSKPGEIIMSIEGHLGLRKNHPNNLYFPHSQKDQVQPRFKFEVIQAPF